MSFFAAVSSAAQIRSSKNFHRRKPRANIDTPWKFNTNNDDGIDEDVVVDDDVNVEDDDDGDVAESGRDDLFVFVCFKFWTQTARKKISCKKAPMNVSTNSGDAGVVNDDDDDDDDVDDKDDKDDDLSDVSGINCSDLRCECLVIESKKTERP